MKNQSFRVCVIAFPWASKAPYKFLSNILKILDPLTQSIILINGNTDKIDRIAADTAMVELKDIGIGMHYVKDITPKLYSVILWIMKCIAVQIKLSLELVNSSRRIDIVIIYMAYPYYLFPLITSKILKKKTVEIMTRSKSPSNLSKIISLQDPLLFKLLDGIAPESNALITEEMLEKYREKILPEGSRFIDTGIYKIKKNLIIRRKLVGYIGRIGAEKGIIEFVKSITLINNYNNDIEFLVGGSGDLMNFVRYEAEKISLENKANIEIYDWIGDDLVDYLNMLKLLILPSRSEGLPTIALEAMACGTPVLATPVGAIPDIIKDGETGFLMENNSPECIAANVIRALEHPDLEGVAERARALVGRKFTFEKAVERWQKILEKV